MNLLAIETSTPVGSVAILTDGKLRLEKQLDVGWSHCQRLLKAIDDVLDSCRMTLDDIGTMAIGIGPGSFTGLRVGLATLKGLAIGCGLPIQPVSSLEALALGGLPHRGHICPCLDAKKKQVYFSLFLSSGEELQRVVEDSVGSPDEVLRTLAGLGVIDDILLIGEGSTVYSEVFSASLGGGVTFAEEARNHPKASNVGVLAAALTGEGPNLSDLEPRYIRESEAKIG